MRILYFLLAIPGVVLIFQNEVVYANTQENVRSVIQACESVSSFYSYDNDKYIIALSILDYTFDREVSKLFRTSVKSSDLATVMDSYNRVYFSQLDVFCDICLDSTGKSPEILTKERSYCENLVQLKREIHEDHVKTTFSNHLTDMTQGFLAAKVFDMTEKMKVLEEKSYRLVMKFQSIINDIACVTAS